MIIQSLVLRRHSKYVIDYSSIRIIMATSVLFLVWLRDGVAIIGEREKAGVRGIS